jgi:hypothetical protein
MKVTKGLCSAPNAIFVFSACSRKPSELPSVNGSLIPFVIPRQHRYAKHCGQVIRISLAAP